MAISFDYFYNYAKLAGFQDEAMMREVFNAATDYFANDANPNDVLDLMTVDNKAPESYKNYMANFVKIKQGTTGITTIAEYNASKMAYRNLFARYGMADVATNENIDKFLLNDVSVQEAADRIDTAFYRVKNADEALKAQLATNFPGVTDTDLMKNILGVGKTVGELEKQISVAGIKAESATAGIQPTLSAEELYKQGVDRGVARKGYQELKQSLGTTTAAAQRAGISVQDLQTELEKENLLGLASQRRKKIQTAEQNLFAGQSGAASISLGKSSAGQF